MDTNKNDTDGGVTDERRGSGLTRRRALGGATFAGAALLVGGKLPGGDSVTQPDLAQAAACVVTGAVEEGPFFVDEGLDRSDVRTDTDNSNAVQAGVPLALTFTFVDTSNSCRPVVGAMIDLWNANAEGKYSDESSNGTLNHDWLRGYQITDSNGQVTFTTIFPRWYSGRTDHLHLMVRTFDGSTQTYEWTTQLFFNEQINEEVLATTPYTAGGRDKTNETDRLYTTANEVALTGSTSAGYAGAYTVGLSGLSASASSGASSSSSSSGSGSTAGGSSTTDETVGARLAGVTLRRPRGGRRSLRLKVVSTESVDARIRLEREGKILLARTAAVKSGTHEVEVPVGNGVEAGPARVDIRFTDEAGNHKTVNHRIVLRGTR